jgi:hypothetical protein
MHCGSITLNVLLCFGCYRFFKQVSEKSECGGTPQNGCIWKICSLHKWASGGFGACVPWVPQAQLYQTPAAHQGLPYPCQHWTQADQSLVPEQTVWCLLHKAFLPSFLPSFLLSFIALLQCPNCFHIFLCFLLPSSPHMHFVELFAFLATVQNDPQYRWISMAILLQEDTPIHTFYSHQDVNNSS